MGPHWLTRLLYSELADCAPARRDEALRAARDEPLDLVELCGIGLALVLVVLVTGAGGHEATAMDRLTAAVVDFAVALPLLVVLAGPFHVRRVRRGLRSRPGRSRS